jgi:long-chain fatty acid transport protein
MHKSTLTKSRVAHAVAALVLSLGAAQAFAAAFAVGTQSGSGLGNAYAGGAAVAEDASTVWSNPAGMSRFSTVQMVLAGNLVVPSFKFNNDGSVAAGNQPLGNGGGDAGNPVFIPAMYVVVPINQQFAFGLGVNVPFGLETEWDDGWIGRYQGLHSKVETLNINPALSWKVNDSFTLGAGVSWQRAKLKFTSAQNYGGAIAAGCAANAQCQPFLAPVAQATYGLDSSVNLDASDDSWGWNVGLMWNITPDTRIGMHYRSEIKMDASGNVDFGLPTIPKTGNAQLDAVLGQLALQAAANPLLQSGGVNGSIKLPSLTNVSFFTKVNPRWDFMADVQYTNWSTIEYLTFNRTNGAAPISTYENFKNTWRVSAGANYYPMDNWKLRGGVAWDQSPVQDAERTPRLPDADRFWLATGAQYTYQKNWKFDVGLAYEFVQSGSSNINAGSTAQYGLLKGSYDVNAWLIGGQVAYSF